MDVYEEKVLLWAMIVILLGVVVLLGLWVLFFRSNESESRSRQISRRSKKGNVQTKPASESRPKADNESKSRETQPEVKSQPGLVRKRVNSSKKISKPLSKNQDVQCSAQDCASLENQPLSGGRQTTSSIRRTDWSPPSVSEGLLSMVERKNEVPVPAATVTTVTANTILGNNIARQERSSSFEPTSAAPTRPVPNHYKNTVSKTQHNDSRKVKHTKSSDVQQKPSSIDGFLSSNISDTLPIQDPVQCQEEGVLFIDNSNIFIEGKKFYSKHQKLRVKADPCFRIDIGKLCQALLNGRRMSYGKLYGSEPPDLDTLWTKIREGGLEVDKFERNYKGEEKEVDNALSSDATAYACEKKAKNSRETIIFLAGDRDYCPAVENILRRGWKVEVAAFSFSMSSKMKQIAITRKSLKIVELDELLVSYDPCPYYVNRQWRPLRANYTHRRIPRENTKVFCFKREFDVDNKTDVMNVRKLADTIVRLVRIPCNFYCHRINERKSRTVFLIFLLSCYGMDDSQDPESPKKVVGVNLGQAWNDCKGLIDRECKDIFDEYQLDRYEDAISFIQSMHTIKNTEQMEMSNAFSRLSIESLPWCAETDSNDMDNEDDMIGGDDDDDDDNNDEDEDIDMSELNQYNDTQTTSNENASVNSAQFKVVKRKPERIHATSSVHCKYSFNCNRAQRCYKKHSMLELEYFRHCERHGLIKKPYYKSKPCYQYIKRNCNTGNTEISPCCPFYHSVEESRCYYCTRFSGEVGHQATQECADKVDKPYFLSGESRY